MNEAQTLEVGHIVKSHGLKGMVIVNLTTNREERMQPGAVFNTDRGPLTVVSASHQKSHYLVSFSEIRSREEADFFRGTLLFAERIVDDTVIWIDQLFGATVIDQAGIYRGIVSQVEANPASDLMVLDTGHLVPLVFISSIEPNKFVTVTVPEGLFEE